MTPEVRDCICHNDLHCSRQSSVLSTGWQSVVIATIRIIMHATFRFMNTVYMNLYRVVTVHSSMLCTSTKC